MACEVWGGPLETLVLLHLFLSCVCVLGQVSELICELRGPALTWFPGNQVRCSSPEEMPLMKSSRYMKPLAASMLKTPLIYLVTDNVSYC